MKVLSSPLTTEVEKYLRCKSVFPVFSHSKLMILIDIKLIIFLLHPCYCWILAFIHPQQIYYEKVFVFCVMFQLYKIGELRADLHRHQISNFFTNAIVLNSFH